MPPGKPSEKQVKKEAPHPGMWRLALNVNWNIIKASRPTYLVPYPGLPL